MKPSISVITPSIRVDGLKPTIESLSEQTVPFEWLPRLSIRGSKPDLCYQMNKAIQEASGELIVFLQDWIWINHNGLEMFWNAFVKDRNTCMTAPVGKLDEDDGAGEPAWDWRKTREEATTTFNEWEIDWGCAPKKLMVEAGLFDERYDNGFGWENVDLAFRMFHRGARFINLRDNPAVAWDHDKYVPHPFKGNPNSDLWSEREREIVNKLCQSV